MFKDYKYSVISKMYITSFSSFLLLSTSNVRMSEGTFCRVEVHIRLGFEGVYFSWTRFPDVSNIVENSAKGSGQFHSR